MSLKKIFYTMLLLAPGLLYGHFFVLGHGSVPTQVPDSLLVKDLLDTSKRLMWSDGQSALDSCQRALDIAGKNAYRELEIEAYLQIGRVFFYAGQYQDAISYYDLAVQKAEGFGSGQKIGEAYFGLGGIRLVMEDYQEATSYYRKAWSNYLLHYGNEGAVPVKKKLSYLNNMGVILSNMKRPGEALAFFQRGLTLAEHGHQDLPVYVQLMNNLADALYKTGSVDDALALYQRADAHVQKGSDILLQAMLKNGLGRAYLDNGFYGKALPYFKEGLLLAKRGKGYSHMHHLSSGLSSAYEGLGQRDSALHYLRQSKIYEDSLKLRDAATKIVKLELDRAHLAETKKMASFFDRYARTLYALIAVSLLTAIFFYGKGVLKTRRIRAIDRSRAHMERENRSLRDSVTKNELELTVAEMAGARYRDVATKISDALEGNLPKGSTTARELSELIDELKREGNYNIPGGFEQRFSILHSGFFDRLLSAHPELTLTERRLAALLKLQLTTKEISQTTGQSIRAVEIARSRLRKKLGLTNTKRSLTNYFIEF